jgi:filamentous hemagglutinin family protein
MNLHASMNRMFRLVWSPNAYDWVAQTVPGRGNGSKRKLMAIVLSLSATISQAGPTGGQVTGGSGTITQSGSTTTIQQSSQNLALNWLTFNIAPQETVDFVQPNATAIAVNRILDPNGSVILGHLNANGQVYLFNPNGVLFGKGAEVNVGGLVASTLNLNDSELGAPSTSFSGTGSGGVVNDGTLTATAGGSIALLGNHVSNTGVISAQLGTVALGAGSAATLTFQGTHLVSLQIDQSVLNSIVANGGLIRADGGQVLMTAGAQKALLASVVNNTGVIEARTLDNHDGTITLRGGMQAGTVNVAGTLDASAPSGGDGGFIETSAAHVEVANAANITSEAASGKTGTWLIDPQDFTVAASGGDMTGATLTNSLGSSNVHIQSSQGATVGNGDININDVVTWNAHTLTLTAANNVNVNAVMTATGTASLDLEPATANGADSAVAGGTVNMGMDSVGNFTGQVNFSGTGTLTMGGQVYTVINALGSGAADTTAGTLQGVQANLTGHYALGSNIDAAATSGWNSGAGFTPIGSDPSSQNQSFAGVFDGLGHTISGLTFNSASTEYSGLFGAVSGVGSANPAVVRNVALTGVVQNCLYGEYCAGLVGEVNQYTTIANVSISGTISGSEIEYAALGVAYLDSYNGGGPTFDSNIINAYVAGTISGNEVEEIGGLVGQVEDGGIIGGHSSVTINLFPTLSNYDCEYIGGLVGRVNYGTIDKSSASGNIILESGINGQASGYGSYEYVGGLVGESGESITNSHATGSITGLCSYGTCGSDDEYIGGLAGEAYGLIGNSYSTGAITLTKDSTYYVGGLAGFALFGSVLNSYSTSPITAPGSNNDYFGGLIGQTYYETITTDHAAGAVTVGANAQNIGGFLGYANSGNNNFSISYSTGAVTAGAASSQVGGFIGYVDTANISNVYTTGSVTSGAGSSQVGGLIGSANGAVVLSNSYAVGAVSPGSGATYVGGLVGYDSGSNTVSNSFWDITSTGQATSADGQGMTTAQMQQQINFASATSANGMVNPNWDFTGTWVMYNGNTYPLLQAFMTALTVTGTVAQTYNGAAFAPTISALTYSVTPNFSDLFGTLTVTGSAVGAVHAGTYSYTPGGLYSDQQGYIIQPYVAGTLTINRAPLTVTGTTASKIYDGTIVAPLSGGTLVGVIGGDTVTLNQAGSFASKNAASGIAITANDSIGGADASDYSIVEPNGLSGNITPATLMVSGTTVGSKVYNGTTSASLTGGSLRGVIGDDTVTLTQAGNFASRNVGTGIGVTAADGLGGAEALDYTIVEPTGLSGNITPATLMVSGTTVGSKVYNGTTSASLTGGSLLGVIGDDTVTLTQAGNFASRNAGTGIAVTAADGLGGAEAIDYTIVEPTGLSGNITPATLMVIGTTVVSKVYNGTAAAPLAGGTLVGVVSGDTVSLNQSGLFASTSAGTGIAVTATDTLSGASADDYSIAEPTGLTGSILPAPSPPNGSSDLVLAALNARTQIVENFVYPQLGANPQVINPSPTIAVFATDADGASAEASGSHQAIAVNVSMKIGATGTLKIENGGLRLPSNLVLGNE